MRVCPLKVRSETFTVRLPMDAKSFAVDAASALPSISCVKGKKQPTCSPLPGEFGTDHGSARVTTSQDVRSLLTIGDTVELGDSQYDVVGPVDGFSFGINRKWTLPPVAHLKARKCLKRLDGGTPMCGTAEVFQGSRVVKTRCVGAGSCARHG